MILLSSIRFPAPHVLRIFFFSRVPLSHESFVIVLTFVPRAYAHNVSYDSLDFQRDVAQYTHEPLIHRLAVRRCEVGAQLAVRTNIGL